MLVAVDANNNRIYAEDLAKLGDRGTECFCPACFKPVTLRSGDIRIPHFAHKRKGNCSHGSDMCEWHVRMQNFFPKESREVRFRDESTGEIHIADVYDEASNIVIEFQHSPITPEEFIKRTTFHINDGRRIVWIFDESKTIKSNPNGIGKLQKAHVTRSDSSSKLLFENIAFISESLQYLNEGNEYNYNLQWRQACISIGEVYKQRWYKWLYKRKVFSKDKACPDIITSANTFCVCVCVNSNNDIVHKIIAEESNYEYILLSTNPFDLNNMNSLEEFFMPEEHWIRTIPWVETIEKRRKGKEFEILEASKKAVKQTQPKYYAKRRRRHL